MRNGKLLEGFNVVNIEKELFSINRRPTFTSVLPIENWLLGFRNVKFFVFKMKILIQSFFR